MNNVDSLFESIVTECREDYVGLWSVIKEVRLNVSNEGNVLELTLSLIKRLLLEGDIVAGSFNTEIDENFREWKMSVDEIIGKIQNDWAELDHEPTGGDVVWLTAKESKPVE